MSQPNPTLPTAASRGFSALLRRGVAAVALRATPAAERGETVLSFIDEAAHTRASQTAEASRRERALVRLRSYCPEGYTPNDVELFSAVAAATALVSRLVKYPQSPYRHPGAYSYDNTSNFDHKEELEAIKASASNARTLPETGVIERVLKLADAYRLPSDEVGYRLKALEMHKDRNSPSFFSILEELPAERPLGAKLVHSAPPARRPETRIFCYPPVS